MLAESPLMPEIRIIETANLDIATVALERLMNRPANLPGLGAFYGPSGYGKTVAAMRARNRCNGYYVQLLSVWGPGAILDAILVKAMGVIKPPRTVPQKVEAAAAQLAASGRPLILDDAGYAADTKARIGVIRDLYEASQSPILLVGEEELPGHLKQWESVWRRVSVRAAAQPVSLEDATRLAPVCCPGVELSEDFLTDLVASVKGSLGRLTVNLKAVFEEASLNGWGRVDRVVWGSRAVHTDDVPVRRL